MVRIVGTEPTFVRGVTSVSVPVLEIVYSEMFPWGVTPEFAAYKNFFEGWTAIDSTPGPAKMGLTESGVKMPELGSSRYATISLAAGIAAYRK
jgi:hypothetical protein